jgi:isocitrate dehydrogenase kinase/phosphatase
MSDHSPVPSGAEAIRDAFDAYLSSFRAITRRASRRFAQRDWPGVHADAVERLDLYRRVVDRTLTWVQAYHADYVHQRPLWSQLKTSYSELVVGREDRELAETFFNSIARRVFSTVGVDRATEFVDPDFEVPPPSRRELLLMTFERRDSTAELVHEILGAFAFRAPYADLLADVAAAAERIDSDLAAAGGPDTLDEVEVVTSVFYRGKGAYIVARMQLGERSQPLLISLLHEDRGMVIDAVITDEDAVSIVFGFTHSYFHVEVERPYSLVYFLKSIMPHKRIAELYITLGYNKHGKTELYRDLKHQLAETGETFHTAPGTAGLVMVTFTLPGFDIIFKVIRDRFAAPKSTTPERVRSKYQLVFRHDRAGRLVDAQEFEHVEFNRHRFAPELLADLLASAGNTVRVEGDRVVIAHLYTERLLVPLDLYLRERPRAAAMDAVHDYGQALRDLAATNIFPGDILLKNFGVTRHGRVVFYDYDELALLVDCNFRELPEPCGIEEEAQAEPWFYVGENDLFPAEFLTFIGFRAEERAHFLAAHRELLEVPFWRQIQDRLRAGEIVDIFPYHSRYRLRPVS